MALLHMCIMNHIDVVVAHVNYHQRKQAEIEEQYVRSFCKTYDITCYVKNDPFVYAGNFEAAARDYRYAFFQEIVEKENLDGMMTAHHQDDLLETYLMQKEKGIVPMCYGIAQTSRYHGISLYRPLLSFTKKDLISYCENHQITYYIDETNHQDIHARNVIRNHTLPTLSHEDRNLLLEEIDTKNHELEEIRQEARTCIENGKVSLSVYRKQKEMIRCCIIRILFSFSSMSEKFVRQIDQIICQKNDFVIDVRNLCIAQRNQYFFVTERPKEYCIQLDSITRYEADHFLCKEEGTSLEAVTLQESDFPVKIRTVKEGDRITMRFGTKKVNRFFIDRHISLIDRMGWPVVENKDGDIVLVPGLGCDRNHYSTKPNLFVSFKEQSNLKMTTNKYGHKSL